MKQIKKLVLIATISAAAGGSLGDTFTIGSDKSDLALAESWEGGVAPGAGDFVSFAVDGFYGPFTLSKDVTYQRFTSGGWGRFDSINGNAAQQFDLCGHTMTLTGYRAGDGYLFDPCNSGPRNHFVFSNGKIAIGQSGNVTIGWPSYYNSQVRLSGIELAGVATLNVGYGGSYNCELRIDGGSSVSPSRMILSSAGVGANTAAPNRLIVDNATLSVSEYFQSGSGGVVELTDGAEFLALAFQSGLLAGRSRMSVSNSTLAVAGTYETAKVQESSDEAEIAGPSARFTAGKFLPGNHPAAAATVLAYDGATVEGTGSVHIGEAGPAEVTISNANLKAYGLVVGASADAAGSSLRICGGGASLAMNDNYGSSRDKDIFGAGGSSRFEVAGGARINPWSWNASWSLYPRTIIGRSSSGNIFSVAGADTVYDSYLTELEVGASSTEGNRFEVSEGAVCNLKRLFLFGSNTIKIADATVNISHGDAYHTSLVVGTAGAVGGRLVLSGAAPKINFTHSASHGGIKMLPGTKIVYELPAAPYETAPLDTYWLNIQPDAGMPEQPLAEIVLDLAGLPKSHDRLVYKLLHVQDVLGGVNAIHADAIARVNNRPEIKAVKGRLEWKDTCLIFTVPGNRGMKMVVR